MANTRQLTIDVENYVRGQLEQKFSQQFQKKKLLIGQQANGTPAYHEFDAVSADGSVICAIKSSSGRTGQGKYPSGKVAGAYKDLYFLLLVKAQRRILILTDPEFYEIFKRNSDGKFTDGLELMFVPLSLELAAKVQAVHIAAREEMAGF